MGGGGSESLLGAWSFCWVCHEAAQFSQRQVLSDSVDPDQVSPVGAVPKRVLSFCHTVCIFSVLDAVLCVKITLQIIE